MPTNDYLPFCESSTGSNLLTQMEYEVATDRTIGNQPGIASSKLNNKAVRQATFIASQFAQYISNTLAEDVLDNGDESALLTQIGLIFVPRGATTTKTTTYTALSTDYFIAGNASGGAFTITLPAASSNPGKTLIVKKIDSSVNAVTIARAGSDTIDGGTSIAMGIQYQAQTLISNGSSSWYVVA